MTLTAGQAAGDVDGRPGGPVVLGAVVQGLVVDPVPGAGHGGRRADPQGALDVGPGGLVPDRSAEFRRDGLPDAVGARLRAEGDLQELLGGGGPERERTAAGSAVVVLHTDPDGVPGAGERERGVPPLPVRVEFTREVAAGRVDGRHVRDPAVVALDGDLQRFAGVDLLVAVRRVGGDLVRRVVRLLRERVATGPATGGHTCDQGHDQQSAAHYGADARRVVHGPTLWRFIRISARCDCKWGTRTPLGGEVRAPRQVER